MLETKKCTSCKISKQLSEFYYDNYHKRFYYVCKNCHNKIYLVSRAKYLKSENGKETLNKASKKARINHPEKWEARSMLRQAVKKGNIIKPVHCEMCDEIKNLQGHSR